MPRTASLIVLGGRYLQGGSVRRNAYQRKIACEVDYHWAVQEEEKVRFKSVNICTM